jgi:hypothetical protein
MAMTELPKLVGEYCAILEQEHRLAERKERLREMILGELTRRDLHEFRTPHGSAERCSRFKLLPRSEAVLSVLSPMDILAFAHFPPGRVRTELVPKYGRDRLLPLFEIQKTITLHIKRSKNPS